MAAVQLANYGRKYFLEWSDFKNVKYRLNVYWRGYQGSAIEILAPKNPLSVTQRNDENYRDVFQTTQFKVTFLTDEDRGIDFRDMITPSEREYYIEWVKVENTSEVLLFKGWVVPSEIEELLKPKNAPFSFTASDMLSNLEHRKMDEWYKSGEAVTLEEVIDRAVISYGLDFALNDMSGWSCSSPDFDQSAFRNLSMRTDAFFVENEPMNLEEVVSTILRSMNCVMFQANGELHIAHLFGYGSKSSTWLNFRKVYSDIGGVLTTVGVWTKTEPTRNFISVPTDLEPINNDMVSRTLPPYKFLTRSYKANYRNLIENGGFELSNVDPSPTNTVENWDLFTINNGTSTVLFQVTEDQAFSNGTKSLKCFGVPSKTDGEVDADIETANPSTTILMRNDISQGDWGVDSFAEPFTSSYVSSQVSISVNFYLELSEQDRDALKAVKYRVALKLVKSGQTFYYDEDEKSWRLVSATFGPKYYMVEESQEANEWFKFEKTINAYKDSEQIYLEIFAPEYDGISGDFNIYVDSCNLISAPIPKGENEPSPDSSYMNLTYNLDNEDVSGELKQEFLFMLSDVNPLLSKNFAGSILENNAYNKPLFKWYYEDSTTKSESILEEGSSYQMNQAISRITRRYNFQAFNNTTDLVTKLDTFTVDFASRDEPLNSAFGDISYSPDSGVVQVEGYTCVSIDSVAEPTDPTSPLDLEITADYLNSATVIGSPCGATFQATDDFTLIGGGISSTELQYATADNVITFPSVNGEYFYIKLGNKTREFTFNSVEDRYYPTGLFATDCN